MRPSFKRFLTTSAVSLLLFSLPTHAAAVSEVGELRPPIVPDLSAVPPAPEVRAEAAAVFERGNRVFLYEKNADVPHYPASTTKLLTAILLTEATEPTDILVASEQAVAVEPSAIFLLPGETITARNALAALLLQSANDVANVIAEHVSGSIQAFAEEMNRRAREIGAVNSHFVNPSGLHDPNHVTTARDLALIASEAASYPEIREIMAYKGLYPLDREVEPRYLTNRNLLLEIYPGAYGGKNGWTEEAHYTYCGMAQRGELDLVVCLLKSPDRESLFEDAAALLDWAFANFEREYLVKEGDTVGVISLPDGEGMTEVEAVRTVSVIASRYSPPVPARRIELVEELHAPLPAGSVAGRYTLNLGDAEISVPLKTKRDIPVSPVYIHMSRWKLYAGILAAAVIALRIFWVEVRRYMRRRRAAAARTRAAAGT